MVLGVEQLVLAQDGSTWKAKGFSSRLRKQRIEENSGTHAASRTEFMKGVASGARIPDAPIVRVILATILGEPTITKFAVMRAHHFEAQSRSSLFDVRVTAAEIRGIYETVLAGSGRRP